MHGSATAPVCVLLLAFRYPVLVDPQGQGRLWLMNREEANQLKVTQLNDKMFRNHLEDCLAFGKVGCPRNSDCTGYMLTWTLSATVLPDGNFTWVI